MAEAKNRVSTAIEARDHTGPPTDSAIKNMQSISAAAENAQTRMSASSQKGKARWGRGIAELSRGVEDFGQQMSVSFDMAVRASANNLTQFLHVINPIAGIFGSIGIAAYFLGPALKEAFGATNELAEKAERFNFQLEKTLGLLSRNRELKQFRQSLDDITADNLEKVKNKLVSDTATMVSELRILRKELQNSVELFDAPMRDPLRRLFSDSRQNIKLLATQEDKLLKRREQAQSQLGQGGRGFLEIMGRAGTVGMPVDPSAPSPDEISKQARRTIESVNKELERVRKQAGLEQGDPTIRSLLDQIEEMKEAGIDIPELFKKILDREKELEILAKKNVLARKAEAKEIKKVVAEQKKLTQLKEAPAGLTGVIEPRTQAFVEMLARTQTGLELETTRQAMQDTDGIRDADGAQRVTDPEGNELDRERNDALNQSKETQKKILQVFQKPGTRIKVVPAEMF